MFKWDADANARLHQLDKNQIRKTKLDANDRFDESMTVTHRSFFS